MLVSFSSTIAHVSVFSSPSFPILRELKFEELNCILSGSFFIKDLTKIKSLFNKFNLEDALLWENVDSSALKSSNGKLINSLESYDVATDIINDKENYLILKLDYVKTNMKKIKISPNARLHTIAYDFSFLTDDIVDVPLLKRISFGDINFKPEDFGNISDNEIIEKHLIAVRYSHQEMVYNVENTVSEFN